MDPLEDQQWQRAKQYEEMTKENEDYKPGYNRSESTNSNGTSLLDQYQQGKLTPHYTEEQTELIKELKEIGIIASVVLGIDLTFVALNEYDVFDFLPNSVTSIIDMFTAV